jgi:hypothetical protein
VLLICPFNAGLLGLMVRSGGCNGGGVCCHALLVYVKASSCCVSLDTVEYDLLPFAFEYDLKLVWKCLLF